MAMRELSRDELVRLYDEYRVTEAASAVAASGDSFWGGGALHIIIEDCNLEDSHIANCREQPDLKPEEAAWLDRFAQLDAEERAACIAIMDGNLAPATTYRRMG